MIPPKINISCIIRGQLSTMGGTTRIWALDFVVFLAIPLLCGALIVYFDVDVDAETYGYALTVFSIFSALLITVQIAIYGLYSKQCDHLALLQEKDEKAKSVGDSALVTRYKKRAEKFSLLNANISYLTLLSCVCASFFLIFVAFKLSADFEKFVAVFLYVHFALSLVMVLKRFHIIFESEYAE